MLIAIAKPVSPAYSRLWMGSIRERLLEFISVVRSSKALSLGVILVLALAIPLTVFIAQKQQDIRQRAATLTQPASSRFGPKQDRLPRFVPNQLIIKLRPEYSLEKTNEKDKKISVQSEDPQKAAIVKSLEESLQKIGASDVKKSVPSAKKPEEVAKIFSQKFPQRAGTLQIQSKVQSIPDLTRFYTVTFDPQRFGIEPRERFASYDQQVSPDRYYEEIKRYERVLGILRANSAIEDAQLNYIYSTTQENSITGLIEGPTIGVINQSLKYTAKGSSNKNVSNVSIHWAKVDSDLTQGSSWTQMGKTESCANYFASGLGECPAEGIFTPKEEGAYYISAVVVGEVGPCSGNPKYNVIPGWLDCGHNDLITLTVSSQVGEPTPTTTSTESLTPVPSLSPSPDYPNDPYFSASNSWGQGYDDQWDMKKIKADQAWPIVATSSATVIVAVSDTGVDYNHEDLRDVMWTDANGKHGYDFVECAYFDWYGDCLTPRPPDDNPMDDEGHGTHVAGTIGASINNGKGIAGTASNVKIMAVKVLNTQGYGLDPWFADGILWATDNGAQVINMSWGGYGDSTILRDAVYYAATFGVVSVAAAGNSGWDARDFYPASFPLVITVGASDPDDKKVWFSNYGPKIDLVAPGGGTDSQCYSNLCAAILSTEASLIQSSYPSYLKVTTHGAGYIRLSGTSMAAPHVAGAAAMVIAKSPYRFDVGDVRAVLLNSADDIELEGKDSDTGYGRLNVYRALTEMNTQNPLAPLVEVSSPSSGRVLRKTASINGTINQPGGEAVFSISYSTSKNGSWSTNGISLTNNGRGNIASGAIGTWDTTKVEDGRYYVRIQAGEQYKYTEQRVIVVNNNLPNGFPARIYEQGFGWGPIITGDVDGDARDDTVIKFGNELVFLNADGQEKEPWPIALGDYDRYVGTQPAIGNVTNNNPGNEIIIASEGSEKNDNTVLAEGLYVLNANGEVLPGWPKSQVDTQYGFTIKLNSYYYPPVLKDLDGDGTSEIIYVSYNDFYTDLITVFKGDGSVLEGFPVLIPGFLVYGPYVTTVNGETRIIIVFHDNNTAGRRMLQYNTQGQIVLEGENIESSAYYLITGLEPAIFADVTGDGNKELVWSGKRGPSSWINPETTKIYFYALGLDGKMVTGWPKIVDTAITEKDECDSNRANCYTASYFRMFYSVVPGDFDQDGNIDFVQMGVHLTKNNVEDPFAEIPLLFGIKTSGGLASALNFSMPSSRIPLRYSYQTVMDTNGDGKQEIVYLAYDNASSGYYLSSVQLTNGQGEIVSDQNIAPRCSNSDMDGPRMSASLAQLHSSGRPSIIAPVCGNISEDFYERRLDVHTVRMEGPRTSHAWPKYLHDSQNTKDYGLVSEPIPPTPSPSPTPTPTPAPPVITSIRPAWIEEKYKAQPWVKQGEKVAIKGSGFSPVTSQNHVYVGGVLMPEQFNTVSADGKTLTFVLTTETNFEIGNYYDVYVANPNGRSNTVKMRIISPTVLFSAIPNPAPRSESPIILRGINFGPKAGSVFIYPVSGGGGLGGVKTLGGGGYSLGEIRSWKNNEIRMVLPKELRYSGPTKEYLVWVNGSYGGKFIYSSNRIKLRVK